MGILKGLRVRAKKFRLSTSVERPEQPSVRPLEIITSAYSMINLMIASPTRYRHLYLSPLLIYAELVSSH